MWNKISQHPWLSGLIPTGIAIVVAIVLANGDGPPPPPPPPSTSTPPTTPPVTTPSGTTTSSTDCAPAGSQDPAGGQTPFESNDNAASAYGPLAPGQEYDAAVESPQDQDWFVFCTAETTQVAVTVKATEPATSDEVLSVLLQDEAGNEYQDYGYNVDPQGTDPIKASLDPGRYYVIVRNYDSAAVGGYSLQISANRDLVSTAPSP